MTGSAAKAPGIGLKGRQRNGVKAYLVVFAFLLATTGVLAALRPLLGLATVTLIYLLVVFLSAIIWGRGPSLAAGVPAFLAINYFFTVPYNTLVVASTQDVISLLVFLFVAEMTSRLVAQLREREADARQRAWEASTLHALSDAVSAPALREETLQTVATRIVEVLGVRECAIFLPDREGRLRLHTAGPASVKETLEAEGVPGSAIRAFLAREPVEEENGLSLPLIVGEKAVGLLHVSPPQGAMKLPEATDRLLRTFAGQAAVVIERARLQQEAAEAEVLRRSDALKSELLSAVSHDLRTPLASIRVASTALQQNQVQWSEETRHELLGMIDAEAARVSRLVGNLLDLTRIEAGVLQPVKEWRDLGEVVARAIDDLRDRLRGHQVAAVIPEGFPLVPLDFTQIEDVLVNLLDNAARHAPEGTEIRIVARRLESDVSVQIENEGPAIPVETAADLFNRFYTGTSPYRGAGLGLAICKGLIEAHGGRIWVERPGEAGARFAFTLPLKHAPAAVGERPSPANP
ncbi:MAG: DUF4118 domain-containing protein [Armatimonadota bacterium]